ncbi:MULTISPECIES: copper chaperone PCu(A)C [Vibrio]|uniref:Copper chaperone PCu(A)C n=1 Tax=Vibrio algicola TaxID=2662262 RepID=A0A5Q0TI40_9VIBR|nr:MULTISPECIES: copper chaperone PCu(A)C [Vibrio]MBD1577650.1 copper chaperone PCu(A)C [Vibrio sp. S11_S32]
MKCKAASLATLSLSALLLSASALAHDGLKYDNPYARATPPNAVNSAVFMTIENHQDKDRSLVSASSDAAEKVELHTVEMNGDMMKMRQVNNIPLPSNGELVLKPGSFHIMLLNVKQPLVEGKTISVTLTYANGDTEELTVPVKKVMAGMKNMSHHGEHKKGEMSDEHSMDH